MKSLYVDVTTATFDVNPGQRFDIEVTISNLSALIDAYQVRLFGLDPQWSMLDPSRLSLFPGDMGIVTITVSLPIDFPAGNRQISVYVQSENTPSDFVITPVSVTVERAPRVGLTLDPMSQTAGKRAQYGMVITNHGNSIVDVTPDAVDPEEQAEFLFTPATLRLFPGEQDVVQVAVAAPRPWVGQPKVRIITFAVTTPARVQTIGTLMQRPRIGRGLITLLGLITAAAVFAAVLSHTLTSVVNKSKVSDKIIEQALTNGATPGQIVPNNPSSISGTVRAGSAGTPVAGVEATLFSASDPTTAVRTSSTSDKGTYRFAELGAGTYRIRFRSAGFNDSWYLGGRVFTEGTDIPLKAGENLDLDKNPPGAGGAGGGGAGGGAGGSGGAAGGGAAGGGAGSGGAAGGGAAGGVALAGKPGVVSGIVHAPDITGAHVTLVISGIADPTVPAIVATADVGADGTFAMANIPTPQAYTLIVERYGSATETRTVTLAPGASATGIQITLRIGQGVISGTVTGAAGTIGGALVEATDGVNKVSTVSLTEGAIGSFSLRDLAVPGVYTITVSASGYAPASQVIELTAANPTATQSVYLTRSDTTIAGTVSDAHGSLGGVSVKVTGANLSLQTATTSQGTATGRYVVPGLTTPGSYTMTFSKDGYIDQVRLVSLDPAVGPPGGKPVDVVLIPRAVDVIGQVVTNNGTPAALANVTITDGTNVRSMLTASQPKANIGRFVFGAMPAGSYTFTASLVGTESVVTIVNVVAGQQTLDLGVLRLGVQASISGSVTWADQQQHAGAEVRLYTPANFPPGNNTGPAANPIAVATIDATGRYQFLAVDAPATYAIAVFANATSLLPLSSDTVTSQSGVAVTYNFTRVPPP